MTTRRFPARNHSPDGGLEGRCEHGHVDHEHFDRRDSLTETVIRRADMETAYGDAAGRTSLDFTELGAGEIGGMTLAPGLSKWRTGLSIGTDLTLSGGPEAVWIFQVTSATSRLAQTAVTLQQGHLGYQVAGNAPRPNLSAQERPLHPGAFVCSLMGAGYAITS